MHHGYWRIVGTKAMLDRGYISKFVGGINDNNVGKFAEL